MTSAVPSVREANQFRVLLEELLDKAVPDGWYGCCSTESVRGREASEDVITFSGFYCKLQ